MHTTEHYGLKNVCCVHNIKINVNSRQKADVLIEFFKAAGSYNTHPKMYRLQRVLQC